MKNTIIYKTGVLFFSILMISCGGGSSGGGTDDEPIKEIPSPKAVTLVFPKNNSECNEGTNITNTTSDVNFQWNLSKDTDSYEIHIKNLITDEKNVQTTTADNLTLTIKRGIPYSWQVVSKASETTKTASSSIFKFYNAGEPVTNHVPFPANNPTPSMGNSVDSGNIVLTWDSGDIDNDITGYEVYFGTENPPNDKTADTNDTTYTVSTIENTVYYWQIITKDVSNNESKSNIFEFRTK